MNHLLIILFKLEAATHIITRNFLKISARETDVALIHHCVSKAVLHGNMRTVWPGDLDQRLHKRVFMDQDRIGTRVLPVAPGFTARLWENLVLWRELKHAKIEVPRISSRKEFLDVSWCLRIVQMLHICSRGCCQRIHGSCVRERG